MYLLMLLRTRSIHLHPPHQYYPPLFPPATFTTPQTGLIVIAYICTVRPFSGVVKCIPPSSGTPPPPLPLPPRCTSISRQFLLREPPRQPSRHLVLEPPQGPSHAGGDHPGLQDEEKQLFVYIQGVVWEYIQYM